MANNPVSDKELLQAFDELLLQELDDNFIVENRPPGFGVTVKEYKAAKDTSESTARRILSNAVTKLGWKKKWMHLVDGHSAWVYYK